MFDVPGLTHQGGLDSFWTDTAAPDADLVRDFLKAIAATVQIRGVFFEPEGIQQAAMEAAQLLIHDRVSKPSPGPKDLGLT